MKRTLSLKREHLALLSDDDLGAVAGGARDDNRYSGTNGITCPLRECVGPLDLSWQISCYGCAAGQA